MGVSGKDYETWDRYEESLLKAESLPSTDSVYHEDMTLEASCKEAEVC